MLSASTYALAATTSYSVNLLFCIELYNYCFRPACEIMPLISFLCEISLTRFSSFWRPTCSMRIIATRAFRQYTALAISAGALSFTGLRAFSAGDPLVSS